MKVSIIVCTLGHDQLHRCLQSLTEQTYEDYEVLVMLERDLENKFNSDSIDYYLTRNFNLSATRNEGIKRATGDLIAFIDDDAAADSRWIESLVDVYREETNLGCIGGKISLELPDKVPEDAKELPQSMLKGFLSATTIKGGRQELERPRIWGCNMAFPASVFEEVGYFDPRLGRTPWNLKGEDEKDVQYRLLETGYRLLWTPKAEVTHIIGQDRLNDSYFLRRAAWQGYSEVIRASKYRRGDEKKELMRETAFMGLLEEMGEYRSLRSLKKRVDSSKKIGRLSALLDLAEDNLGFEREGVACDQ